MRIFVTGAQGFLGAEVAQMLKANGHDVAGIDNYLTTTGNRISDEISFLTGDVQRMTSEWAWFYGVDSCDAVVHCAAIARSTWPNEAELWEHNVVATQAVLSWGVPVIFASSSVVGLDPLPNVYARTKAVAERLVLGRPGNLALRFGNIYGPGQSTAVLGGSWPNVVAAMDSFARSKRHVYAGTWPEDRRRCFVHVRDAAAAVVAAVSSDVRGTWLDICGEEASITDIAQSIAHAYEVGMTRGPARDGDPIDIPQDPLPAKHLLGWEPTIDLATGLKEVCDQ